MDRSLAYRHMNFTKARREQIGSMRAVEIEREKSHYWHIERKAKRGGTWIFVRDFAGTKAEAADLWNKHYRHSKATKFRLRHRLSY